MNRIQVFEEFKLSRKNNQLTERFRLLIKELITYNSRNLKVEEIVNRELYYLNVIKEVEKYFNNCSIRIDNDNIYNFLNSLIKISFVKSYKQVKKMNIIKFCKLSEEEFKKCILVNEKLKKYIKVRKLSSIGIQPE